MTYSLPPRRNQSRSPFSEPRSFRTAAEIFGGGSFKAYEAFFRLQTGDEADVRAALDFYRSVGATRYTREAEALLAVEA